MAGETSEGLTAVVDVVVRTWKEGCRKTKLSFRNGVLCELERYSLKYCKEGDVVHGDPSDDSPSGPIFEPSNLP